MCFQRNQLFRLTINWYVIFYYNKVIILLKNFRLIGQYDLTTRLFGNFNLSKKTNSAWFVIWISKLLAINFRKFATWQHESPLSTSGPRRDISVTFASFDNDSVNVCYTIGIAVTGVLNCQIYFRPWRFKHLLTRG